MNMELAEDCGTLFLLQSFEWLRCFSLYVALGSLVVTVLTSYAAYCYFHRGITIRWHPGTRRVNSRINLRGKTVLITGANAGIGRETAIDLASRGARVIMGCRNPTKAKVAIADVRKRSSNENVIFKQIDLSDLNSVKKCAEKILKEEERLDVLINNAGLVSFSDRGLTPEGYDITMATNHVGHFVLTLALINIIKKSAPSRVINVSSFGHLRIKQIDYTNISGKGVSGFNRYKQSKLANIHFTKVLARRLSGTGVTAYSVNPGTVYTNIWESSRVSLKPGLFRYILSLAMPLLRLFLLNEKDGAQTTIYCAVDESIAHLSGGYFTNCSLGKESKLAEDEQVAKQLWDITCKATGVDPNILPE
ncbi:retinol dehydrogenase 12-like [Lytechinus variegatus]|uniref:retinol dehydrogenase 12-like n=1 Tax=Lytechinus variegatus TaxID=7654 RepID=UPI001BB2CF56|nr:retinol dehydrogenase 12-like [Lytechinus variegatus]